MQLGAGLNETLVTSHADATLWTGLASLNTPTCAAKSAMERLIGLWSIPCRACAQFVMQLVLAGIRPLSPCMQMSHCELLLIGHRGIPTCAAKPATE